MFLKIYKKIYYLLISYVTKMLYFSYIKTRKNVRFRTIPIIEDFNCLLIEIGNNVLIKENFIVRGGGKLLIGDNTHIGSYNLIGCNSEVIIGKDCMIADFVTIRDTNHNFDKIDIPMNRQGIKTSKVVIEDDVWIGHGAIVLSNITIGQGAIIGAGSIVTKSVAPFNIIAGNPAKIIGDRNL